MTFLTTLEVSPLIFFVVFFYSLIFTLRKLERLGLSGFNTSALTFHQNVKLVGKRLQLDSYGA